MPYNLEPSGALFSISGVVPVNATWSEDISFLQSGAPMDISGLDWKMTFRQNDDATESPFLTLSTDDGTLSIQDDADGNADCILRISLPAGTTGYVGDYICDLASSDAQSTVTLWGHGIVTFRANPVTF